MFLEILTKAKIEPWPRLFHNLRGSLQTDLQDRFPAHVVNAWLGNSERVAQKHYLKVTQEHVATAVKQGVGHTLAESASLDGNGRNKMPENLKTDVLTTTQLTPTGQTKPLKIESFQFSEDNSKILIFTNAQRVWRFKTRGDYWLYDVNNKTLKQIGKDRPSRPSSCGRSDAARRWRR